MGTNILSQLTRPSNGKQPNADNRITVKLTQPARTTETGITLPAGAVGQVIGMHFDDDAEEWNVCHWQINFIGLPTVIALPYDSPLIQIVNGGER